MKKPFDRASQDGKMKRGQRCLQHPLTPRHETPDSEVTNMPFENDYNDSADAGNREQSSNWQSIGELAERLVRK